MRRILIDKRIKDFVADYVKEIPLVVGDVEACLRGLANELEQPSTMILVRKAVEGEKAKTKQSGRKIIKPESVEVANAEQSVKDRQESYKFVHHKGDEYKRVSEYIEAIADRYAVINNLLPSKYNDLIDAMEKILGDITAEDVWVQLKGKDKQPLYELIVETMGYGDVRAKLMPKYVKKLEIKTCVYCNSQFALTTLIEDVHEKIKTGKRGRPKEARVIPLMGGYYELDHNKPKSKYPYLCTNFYNLQPCCSSCNKRKSAQDLPFSIYYEEGDPDPAPLRFAISEQDVINFHTAGKCKGVKPYLCDETNPTKRVVARKDGTLAEQFNYIFDIDKIYAEHEDEVEELLWRNRIYTHGIVSATSSQFKDLQIEDFDFGRYILGTYPNREDALKRPLTAMKQDIWEQVIKDE